MLPAARSTSEAKSFSPASAKSPSRLKSIQPLTLPPTGEYRKSISTDAVPGSRSAGKLIPSSSSGVPLLSSPLASALGHPSASASTVSPKNGPPATIACLAAPAPAVK